MSKVITILCMLIAWTCSPVKAGVVLHNDCGSSGSIYEVRVQDCEGIECVINKGQTILVEIDFKPDFPANWISMNQYWVVASVPTEVPDQPANGCDYITNAKCPLDASSIVTFSYPFYVDPEYPSLQMTTRWELRNDLNVLEVCVEYFTIMQ